MRKIKYIEQNEHSECGLACCAMLLQYYKVRTSLFELREKYGVPKGGNNLFHLKTILNDFNITTKAVEIKDIDDLKTINHPFICFWENAHFIVVEKITARYAYIVDPAIGKEKIELKTEFMEKFSYIILFVLSQSAYTEKGSIDYNSSSRKFYKELITENISSIVILFVFSLLLQIFSLYMPLMIQNVIDSNIDLFANYNIKTIILVIVIVFMFHYLCQVTRGLIISKMQYAFTEYLQKKYVSKLTNLALSFFVNRTTGDIIFRSNLITYIQQFISQQFVKTLIDIIFLFVYLIVMINYSLELTIITLILTILIIIISLINTKKYLTLNDRSIIIQSQTSSALVELVEGIETIKSLGVEKDFYDKWERNFNKQQNVEYKKNKMNSWIGSLNQTVQFLLPFIVIISSLYFLKLDIISLGVVVAFPTLTAAFLTPISSVLNSFSEMIVVKSYFNKINEVMLQKDLAEDSTEKKKIEGFFELALENVSFKYSYFENKILNNINLNIKKGEKIAIVGPSGSGKSTLLKIIANLYRPTDGNVNINNISLNYLEKNSYRKVVGYVNQTPMIFNATLLENIVVDSRNYKKKDLLKTIHDTMIDQMLFHLPKGLQSKISESGMNLSGGQMQKIALARAILKSPELLLLDEPTSSLDNISEEHIMSALKTYDIAMIVVSHRLSTIKHFDKIIVINDGKI